MVLLKNNKNMNFRNPLLFGLLLVVITTIGCTQPQPTDAIFKQSDAQMRSMLNHISELEGFPRTTNPDGSLRMVKPADWTSGFFPGSLWYQSEYSDDKF